ncbi:hypothetical protein PACTADRAFT_77424 [Pachysolen tannophilus NRRL Y-2460]|uniref:Roadblock/LAMTOR2 domain-containing protein n=1 Tax=Pachysolen tannophilus NRRL Y-2460 TaxID=669874 RepID=A0A1E4TQ95_PACTA|nr:hypothetical protein PACTADRAFT_77424 [Pachysolen tannophilus NRRL Y-2460]
MLRSRNITQILLESIQPISGLAPLSASLLSVNGQPLCSVFSKEYDNNVSNKEQDELSSFDPMDNLNIYSLIAVNKFRECTVDDGNKDGWMIVQLDNGYYLALKKLKLLASASASVTAAASQSASASAAAESVGKEDDDSPLILMLVCDDGFPKKISKLKLDRVSEVLEKGLKGYKANSDN